MHLLTLHLYLTFLTSPSLITKLNSSPEDLACVASVYSRGLSRKLGQEKNKMPAADILTGLKLMQTLTNSPDVCALLNSFHDYTTDNQSDPFHPKILWTPPTDKDDALNAYSTLLTWPIHHSEPRRIRDNLPKAQRRALRLKQRHDIVIKSADKGSATVIMDRKWYLDECYRQLNNPTFYEQQDTDLTDTIQKRVTEYVKRMLNDELIDKKKTNNTYYIRILNPNASIFSL